MSVQQIDERVFQFNVEEEIVGWGMHERAS